jgi:hypothetical protein
VNLPVLVTPITLALIGASFVLGGFLSLIPGPKRVAVVLILSGLGFIGAGYYVW